VKEDDKNINSFYAHFDNDTRLVVDLDEMQAD
jgi:hypothetical protein